MRWHIRTDDERQSLAKEVVARALSRRHPRMSLAAQQREALRARVTPSLVQDVLSRARDLLDEQMRDADPLRRSGRWLSTAEAALILGVSASWIRQTLETTLGRRSLGYPWFDGRRWHIPAAACDPMTRSTYLSELPPVEPPENVAHLD